MSGILSHGARHITPRGKMTMGTFRTRLKNATSMTCTSRDNMAATKRGKEKVTHTIAAQRVSHSTCRAVQSQIRVGQVQNKWWKLVTSSAQDKERQQLMILYHVLFFFQ